MYKISVNQIIKDGNITFGYATKKDVVLANLFLFLSSKEMDLFLTGIFKCEEPNHLIGRFCQFIFYVQYDIESEWTMIIMEYSSNLETDICNNKLFNQMAGDNTLRFDILKAIKGINDSPDCQAKMVEINSTIFIAKDLILN